MLCVQIGISITLLAKLSLTLLRSLRRTVVVKFKRTKSENIISGKHRLSISK